MDKLLVDQYEKLISEEDSFAITKDDLLNLVDENKVKSKDSYQLLHKLGGVNGLLDRLDVQAEVGLCDDDNSKYDLRKKLFGKNTPYLPYEPTFIHSLKNVFQNKIIVFLIFAATIRLIIDLIESKGKWFDYCSIYFLVIIISLVVAFTDYSKDKVFTNFLIESEEKLVRVLRNQTEILIKKEEIVVGDIVVVTAGDISCIDGILIKAFSMSINFEDIISKYHHINFNKNWLISSLQSKKENIKTNLEEYPIIFSGSKIFRGYGYILVLSVGQDTYYNKKNSQSQNLKELKNKRKENEDNRKEFKKSFLDLEESKMEIKSSDVTIDFKKKFNNDNINCPEENFFTNTDNKQNFVKSKTSKILQLNSNISNQSNREPFIKKDEELNGLEKEFLNKKSTTLIPSNREENYTPLQIKLQAISMSLSKFGIIASIITSLFFIVSYLIKPEHFGIGADLIQVIFDAILYGIVIVVIAVPGSFPLVVTLILAFSLNNMRKQKTIIKNLEACETMACVNCICTDYYGIITRNDMKITTILIENKSIEGKLLSNLHEQISIDMFEFFCEGIAVNTIAFSAEVDNQTEYFGDPVERALTRYLRHIKIDCVSKRNDPQRPIIDSSAYSPDNKISFTVIEMDEKRDFVRVYVKGTPEYLLDLITIYIGETLSLQSITPKQYEKIKSKSLGMTKEGIIPLLICYRDVPRNLYNQTRHAYMNKESEFMINIIRQLTFICLIGIKDELKENIQKDIIDCQKAGITVRMVTSQSKESSLISAEMCKIITNKNYDLGNRSLRNNYTEIVDAQEDLRKFVDIPFLKKSMSITSFNSFEFTVIDSNKFNKNIENALVISKAQARDKFLLVAALKQKGYVVAVTGDGVSDSLAMGTAHIGISMGYRSSDMSKAAADVILMDDSFKSIVTAIVYGRNIFDSVRKFLQFQITATIVVVCLILISAFPYVNFYFYPNQILWINLILNTISAVCLSSEQPDREEVLKKKPYSMKKSIIKRDMILKIVVQSTVQIILLTILILFAPSIFDIPNDCGLNYRVWTGSNGIHTTIVFNCIIFMQFFNAFISRTLDKDDMNIFKNLMNNQVFLIVEPLVVIVQLLIISRGGRITRTRPLDLEMHVKCFLISSLTLLTLPILKYVPIPTFRKEKKSNKIDISDDGNLK